MAIAFMAVEKDDIGMKMKIVIIFAAYIVCWGPALGILLVVSITTLTDIKKDFSQYLMVFYFAEVLNYANSLVNPIIYFVIGKDFRKAADLLFKCNKLPPNMDSKLRKINAISQHQDTCQ